MSKGSTSTAADVRAPVRNSQTCTPAALPVGGAAGRLVSLTMVTLAALGVLDRCPTFPTLDLGRVRRVYLPSPMQRRGARRLRSLAATRRRSDLAQAIGRAVTASALRAGLLATIRVTLPFSALSPIARRLRRAVLNGAVQ